MFRIVTTACIVLLALTLAVTGCDKLKLNITGNVTGQVMNEAGQGQGYMSVKLCDAASGADVDVQTAEDSGNFFFEKVPAGEYVIKLVDAGGGEMACDAKPIKLGAGKTVSVTVTLLSAEGQAASQGEE